MAFKNILVITDNLVLYERFRKLLKELDIIVDIAFRFSSANHEFRTMFAGSNEFMPIDIKGELLSGSFPYDLIISLHCKQLFPAELIKKVTCINVHPGLNPYNRGWYPQIFSIINKLPLGATIHEIDEEIDHGNIIAQEEIPVYSWDTSFTAYSRVIAAECMLLRKHLKSIVNGNYQTRIPIGEGNVNYNKDFKKLCVFDLAETGTLGSFIDRLRALTHGSYHNAYFRDKNGNKIFVGITLKPETEIINGNNIQERAPRGSK